MAGSPGGIRAGKAYVELSTQDKITTGLRAAEAKLKAFGESVAGIGARIGGLGASITAPFLGAAAAFASAGSALANMSVRTGFSVEALSALGFAASQTGTDMESVEVGIRRMQKSIVKGSMENLLAEASFKSLGLSVDELIKMSPAQQFGAIARALSQIPNPTAKAAMAMEIFGRSGANLIPLIDNLDGLTNEAKDFGLVVSTQSAEEAHRFGQSMDLLSKSITALIRTVGSAVAPTWTAWNVAVARNIKTAREWLAAHKPLLNTIYTFGFALTAAGAAFVGLGAAISLTGVLLGGVASAIGPVVAAFAFLISPAGQIVILLAAAGIAFFRFTDSGQQALSYLGDRFSELLADARATFAGIGDALKAGDISLAAKILWSSLKIEWIKGVNFLRAIWLDWSTATVEVFSGVSFSIARFFTDAWAGIATTFLTTTGVIRDGWTQTVGFLMKSWNTFGGFFAKVWEWIKAKFKGGDLDAALKGIDAATSAGNSAVDVSTANALAGDRESRAGQIGRIQSDRDVAQQSINDQQQTENDARRQAAQDAIAAGAAALAKEQANFAGLTGKARAEAAALKEPLAPKAGGGGEALSPEGLDKALEETKAKVDVKGTFNAAAIRGLGVGDSLTEVGKEQKKEQEKTNKHLESLNEKARQSRLVFQS